MTSDLPVDLLEEILSRVPATSLGRLRSTCKRWNSLFKDQRFTAKHFRNASKESILLMSKEYRVFPMRVNLNVTPPSIEFKGPLSLIKDSHLNPEHVNIYTVFHCDGLLLCTTSYNTLVVWNPCLGETRWIEFQFSSIWHFTFALGYGKIKSGHNYKILMWKDHRYRHIPLDIFKIYEFSSDSWRVLDDVSIDHSILSKNGMCLKGNIYWLAYDKENKSEVLLSFDFTVERFKRLGLPQDDDHNMAIAISVVGDKKLSMLSVSKFTLNIWITNGIVTDDGDGLKWSKFLTLNIPFSYSHPEFASYLIDEEKKVAMSCDDFYWENIMRFYIIGEDNEIYRKIPLAKSSTLTSLLWRPPIILNYIPSLVQVSICKRK